MPSDSHASAIGAPVTGGGALRQHAAGDPGQAGNVLDAAAAPEPEPHRDHRRSLDAPHAQQRARRRRAPARRSPRWAAQSCRGDSGSDQPRTPESRRQHLATDFEHAVARGGEHAREVALGELGVVVRERRCQRERALVDALVAEDPIGLVGVSRPLDLRRAEPAVEHVVSTPEELGLDPLRLDAGQDLGGDAASAPGSSDDARSAATQLQSWPSSTNARWRTLDLPSVRNCVSRRSGAWRGSLCAGAATDHTRRGSSP